MKSYHSTQWVIYELVGKKRFKFETILCWKKKALETIFYQSNYIRQPPFLFLRNCCDLLNITNKYVNHKLYLSTVFRILTRY